MRGEMAMSQPLSEKDWRARDDAHTLAEAEHIKDDNGRLDAATTAAKRMADEEAERGKALRKVARRKTSTSPKTHSKKIHKRHTTITKVGGGGTIDLTGRI